MELKKKAEEEKQKEIDDKFFEEKKPPTFSFVWAKPDDKGKEGDKTEAPKEAPPAAAPQ